MIRLAIGLIAALVVIAAFALTYQMGYGSAREDMARQAAEDYQEGREDAQDALDDVPDDDGGIVDWLRRFAD